MIDCLVYDPLRGFMEGRGVVVLVLIERWSLREAVTLLVDSRAKCAVVAFQFYDVWNARSKTRGQRVMGYLLRKRRVGRLVAAVYPRILQQG